MLFRSIGEKKGKKLLETFKSIEEIKRASPEDLKKVPGISQSDIDQLKKHL